MKHLFAGLAGLLACLLSVPVRADSWLPPQSRTWLSADGTWRLRVDPRPVSSALDYFADKAKRREPAGAPPEHRQSAAMATVDHADGAGGWSRVWRGPLVNEVAPVEALIANGGDHVATFDNWHSMGHGPNAVAIYGRGGRLIRKLALSDILPAAYVDALSHSVSSIWWRGEPRLPGDGTLVIPVLVPKESDAPDRFVNAVLRLSDGALVSGGSPEWQAALDAARKVAAAQRAAEERERQAFAAPLLGPRENTEEGWYRYLNEAFFRTAPDWRDSSPSTTVLRDPVAADYAQSEQWLREALAPDRAADRVIAFASIAPFGVLAAKLRVILSESPAGQLKRARIYIAGPRSALPMLRALFARSGARVFCLDPTQPIRQRPERLAGRAR